VELTDTVSYIVSNNKISQSSENFFSFLAAQSLSPAFEVSEFLRLSKIYRVGYSVITNIIFFSLHNRSAGNFSKLLRGLFMQTRSEVLLSFWFFILASWLYTFFIFMFPIILNWPVDLSHLTVFR
jgi:hypothetical protein